jgi:hypothetical protein
MAQQTSERVGHKSQAHGAFTVEIDTPTPSTVILTTIPMRLRSRWSINKVAGKTIGRDMYRMPNVPGMHVVVNIKDSTVTFHDPLSDNQELMANVSRVINSITAIKGPDRCPVPTTTQQLSKDQLKTLLFEMHRRVNQDPVSAKIVRGTLPDPEQIEAMPGRQLNDPHNSNPRKPRFVDQLEEWFEMVDKR